MLEGCAPFIRFKDLAPCTHCAANKFVRKRLKEAIICFPSENVQLYASRDEKIVFEGQCLIDAQKRAIELNVKLHIKSIIPQLEYNKITA